MERIPISLHQMGMGKGVLCQVLYYNLNNKNPHYETDNSTSKKCGCNY